MAVNPAPEAQTRSDEPRWAARERWTRARLDELPELDPEIRRAAEQTIVLAHLDLVDALVRQVAPRFRDQNDLRQVGYIGLMKAVHRFDASRPGGFLPYAVPTITGEIKRYLRDHAWAVRPPRRVQETRLAVAAIVPDLYQELRREPSLAEVALRLRIERKTVTEAVESATSLRPVSLEATVADGESTLGSLLGSVDARLEQADERLWARRALSGLSPRERRILYLRFFEERTQREIADDIGVTQMQVSRLLGGILAKLRARLVEAATSSAPVEHAGRRTA